MVQGPQELLGELQLGKWIVYRWEHLGWHGVLDMWKQDLINRAPASVDLVFIDISKKDVTVVVNGALTMPTFEQVQSSIAAIDYHRFTEKEIGSELFVKTGGQRR